MVKDRLEESHTPYEQIVHLFHKCCPSLKPVTTLTSHCKRGTSFNWQATFGWIIRPDKFFAILEGAYETFKAPEAAYLELHYGSPK